MLMTALSFAVAACADPPLPAFPGAEGFGAASTGGRGGRVIHVTNLNDAGEGSFRAALEATGPRIIVFDVGGTIELRSGAGIPRVWENQAQYGRVTIAGQTAPGGITIIGATLSLPMWAKSKLFTPHIIARHVRVRGVHNIAGPNEGGDALNMVRAKHAIVDHCSFTGSCDEVIDAISSQDLTIQWCTIEEPALAAQGGNQHPEGDHNLGLISGYDSKNVTVHHCLFAHCAGRNPLINHGPTDICNNVVYNFGIGVHLGGHRRHRGWAYGTGNTNIVGNYFRWGPTRRRGRTSTPFYGLGHKLNRYYFRDNLLDIADDTIVRVQDPWVELVGKRRPARAVFWGGGSKSDKPIPTPAPATQDPADAYGAVLAGAGAWPRDATTRRIITETRTRTGGAGLNGPYERFATRTDGPTSAKFDRDRDGMPDAWERAHGLDPADPADGNKVVPKGASRDDRHAGYTYVEFYLNELADSLVAVDGELCTVQVAVEGKGRVVCAHSGRTPHWSDRTRRRPLYVDWGTKQVFGKGSTVVLRAVGQTDLVVGAPQTSTFERWTGVAVDGSTEPLLRLTVDRDTKLTAHFRDVKRD
jgi:pectate lyase